MAYQVAIERGRLDAGDIPLTCVMTGAQEGVELVEITLNASGGMSLGWSWLSMSASIERETVSATLRLPFSRGAARRFKLFRIMRALLFVAIACGAVFFYWRYAGDILGRSNSPWEWAAVFLGPLAPLAVVASICNFLIRPRVEPVLTDCYQTWVKLLIPSETAATDIEAWMSQRPGDRAA